MASSLRQLRIQRLWSQQELARRADVSLRTIVNIESGARPPRLLTMRRVAEALGVDWAEIDEFRATVNELEGKVAA
jgi:transcriptional regulator with XRE-family HTH domain